MIIALNSLKKTIEPKNYTKSIYSAELEAKKQKSIKLESKLTDTVVKKEAEEKTRKLADTEVKSEFSLKNLSHSLVLRINSSKSS